MPTIFKNYDCFLFMQVLQVHTNVVASPHLLEELTKLLETHIVGSKFKNERSGDSASLTLDIEAESNSYFHKLFNGELTVDAIVQILARFKESSVERYTGLQLSSYTTSFIKVILACPGY